MNRTLSRYAAVPLLAPPLIYRSAKHRGLERLFDLKACSDAERDAIYLLRALEPTTAATTDVRTLARTLEYCRVLCWFTAEYSDATEALSGETDSVWTASNPDGTTTHLRVHTFKYDILVAAYNAAAALLQATALAYGNHEEAAILTRSMRFLYVAQRIFHTLSRVCSLVDPIDSHHVTLESPEDKPVRPVCIDATALNALCALTHAQLTELQVMHNEKVPPSTPVTGGAPAQTATDLFHAHLWYTRCYECLAETGAVPGQLCVIPQYMHRMVATKRHLGLAQAYTSLLEAQILPLKTDAMRAAAAALARRALQQCTRSLNKTKPLIAPKEPTFADPMAFIRRAIEGAVADQEGICDEASTAASSADAETRVHQLLHDTPSFGATPDGDPEWTEADLPSQLADFCRRTGSALVSGTGLGTDTLALLADLLGLTPHGASVAPTIEPATSVQDRLHESLRRAHKLGLRLMSQQELAVATGATDPNTTLYIQTCIGAFQHMMAILKSSFFSEWDVPSAMLLEIGGQSPQEAAQTLDALPVLDCPVAGFGPVLAMCQQRLREALQQSLPTA